MCARVALYEPGSGDDVIVEQQDDLTPGPLEPELPRGGSAPVPARHRLESGMGSGEILEQLQGAVVRSVVHNHDLVGRTVGQQRHECLPQLLAATARRDHHRNCWFLHLRIVEIRHLSRRGAAVDALAFASCFHNRHRLVSQTPTATERSQSTVPLSTT